MSKLVVVVFPNEAKASEGLHAFKELDAEDSLTVYAGAVIVKDAEGTVSLMEMHGRRRFGAAVGAVLCGLIGLIGGPTVAVVGAAGGALAGGWRDALSVGVDLDFLDQVSRELTPGKSAIVAEIEEDWVTPLDSRMEAAGGVVLRSWRDDLEDEHIRREAERRRAELAQLQAERAQAREEWQSKLAARVEEARAKCQDVCDRSQARLDRLREETDAKMEALQDQAAETKEGKDKLEQRIAEIRADYDRRSAQLKQAWELTRDALAP
jgi:uncharacterized membrane protein